MCRGARRWHRTVRTSARELTWLDWPSARWRRHWHRRPTYRFCGRREARRRRRALSTHWIPLVIGVAAAIWLPSVAGTRADGAIRGVDLPCWHHRNQSSHRTDRRDCCCAECRRAAGRYQRPFSFVGCSGRARPSRRQDTVRLTIKTCSRHGKIAVVGGAYQPDWLRLYAGMGVRMLLVGNDLSLLVGALRERAAFAGRLDTDGKA